MKQSVLALASIESIWERDNFDTSTNDKNAVEDLSTMAKSWMAARLWILSCSRVVGAEEDRLLAMMVGGCCCNGGDVVAFAFVLVHSFLCLKCSPIALTTMEQLAHEMTGGRSNMMMMLRNQLTVRVNKSNWVE